MSQPCASLLALREVEAGGLKGTDDLASAALGRNGSPLCRSRRGTTRANFDDRGFRPGHEGRYFRPSPDCELGTSKGSAWCWTTRSKFAPKGASRSQLGDGVLYVLASRRVDMSVAFVREESAEAAQEVSLPPRRFPHIPTL